MNKGFLKFNRLKLCWAIFALIFLLVSSTNAQESGSLRLKLVDQNSGLIEKASAVLKNDKGVEKKQNIGTEAGFILFSSLEKGSYTLEITSQGFKPLIKIINVERGNNFLEVALEIQPINENVTVELSKREKRFGDAISKVFSRKEIEDLPDNPQDIENEFKRRYGDDVVIRVDGFTGGQFPDKSQIASITIILSPIDAEFHLVGKTLVDIKTRVSAKKNWSGFFSGSFADARLNARNAFAAERLPMQNKDFYLFLNPPSIDKRASFSFSISGSGYRNGQNFLKQLPIISKDTIRISDNLSLTPSVRFNYNLNKNHTLYANYQFRQSRGKRLGLGVFDFSERAYSSFNRSNLIRLSENASLEKYSNEFRFEYSDNDSKTTPDSFEPSIIVPGNFNRGGAGIETREKSQKINLTDILTFSKNRHLIKIGGELEIEKNKYRNLGNGNGRFTFSTIESFRQNTPLLFEQRKGTSLFHLSQINTALFFQDYVSLNENFQIGIGGRWEAQSRVKDFNNFSPRLSFVWSPEKTGKLILRGGFGTIFTYLDASFLSPILSGDGEQSSELIIRNPGFPNPFAKGNVVSQSEKPSVTRLDKTKNPETYLSFLGAIYTPVDGIKLTTAYISTRGIWQPRIRDINAPINGIRPDSNFGRIALYEFAGNITANALVFKSEIKFRGFAINGDYTILKSTADFNDGELPSNSYNVSLDRGATNDDRRHEINIDSKFSLYKLIRYKPLYSTDVWIKFSAQSGLPYTITTGKDDNEDGIINDRPFGVKRNSLRQDWTNQTDLYFTCPVPLASFFGGSRANADKKIAAKGFSPRTNFTLSINNIFNQTNRRGFVGVETSPFFKQATFSEPARNIRFGINILF